eukprot:TRINITY_DN30917_c0_g1_i1.p1 TRINITY_DN30917_c0_g1~~TRINITY_DN30917_c0_g1_i1.p1  ORF type:complete len:823 (-),score=144.49 TRINITY_DN30917_c0_g1_i1:148-2313(-)
MVAESATPSRPAVSHACAPAGAAAAGSAKASAAVSARGQNQCPGQSQSQGLSQGSSSPRPCQAPAGLSPAGSGLAGQGQSQGQGQAQVQTLASAQAQAQAQAQGNARKPAAAVAAVPPLRLGQTRALAQDREPEAKVSSPAEVPALRLGGLRQSLQGYLLLGAPPPEEAYYLDGGGTPRSSARSELSGSSDSSREHSARGAPLQRRHAAVPKLSFHGLRSPRCSPREKPRFSPRTGALQRSPRHLRQTSGGLRHSPHSPGTAPETIHEETAQQAESPAQEVREGRSYSGGGTDLADFADASALLATSDGTADRAASAERKTEAGPNVGAESDLRARAWEVRETEADFEASGTSCSSDSARSSSWRTPRPAAADGGRSSGAARRGCASQDLVPPLRLAGCWPSLQGSSLLGLPPPEEFARQEAWARPPPSAAARALLVAPPSASLAGAAAPTAARLSASSAAAAAPLTASTSTAATAPEPSFEAAGAPRALEEPVAPDSGPARALAATAELAVGCGSTPAATSTAADAGMARTAALEFAGAGGSTPVATSTAAAGTARMTTPAELAVGREVVDAEFSVASAPSTSADAGMAPTATAQLSVGGEGAPVAPSAAVDTEFSVGCGSTPAMAADAGSALSATSLRVGNDDGGFVTGRGVSGEAMDHGSAGLVSESSGAMLPVAHAPVTAATPVAVKARVPASGLFGSLSGCLPRAVFGVASDGASG